MSTATLALLADRGVIAVSGEDAKNFLDNLITNDMDLLDTQPAIHAGLLTPQGKILFAFFVVRHGDGFVLETRGDQVADLIKRLTLYKLRAKVTLSDMTASHGVAVGWGGAPPSLPQQICFPDPRHGELGWRLIVAREAMGALAASDAGAQAWHDHRISLGIAEAGYDFHSADTFPHEANFDLNAGVSFTKGCFVGQEVVARMQHKTVVRKRIVRVQGNGPLVAGASVTAGPAEIGSIGSVASDGGLALVRLDRASDAQIKGIALEAGGVPIAIDADALQRYRTQSESRQS
ncbi:MAG: folate-binding protein [Hyphomicrobiaceae bacterium]